jgi:hypothetical protein
MLLETIGQAQLQRRCRRQVKNDATADRLKAPTQKSPLPLNMQGSVRKCGFWHSKPPQNSLQHYAEIASDKPWYKDIVLSSVTHILVNFTNTRSARDRGFEDLES